MSQDEVPLAELATVKSGTDETGTKGAGKPAPQRQLRQTRSRSARHTDLAVKPAVEEAAAVLQEEDLDIEGGEAVTAPTLRSSSNVSKADPDAKDDVARNSNAGHEQQPLSAADAAPTADANADASPNAEADVNMDTKAVASTDIHTDVNMDTQADAAEQPVEQQDVANNAKSSIEPASSKAADPEPANTQPETADASEDEDDQPIAKRRGVKRKQSGSNKGSQLQKQSSVSRGSKGKVTPSTEGKDDAEEEEQPTGRSRGGKGRGRGGRAGKGKGRGKGQKSRGKAKSPTRESSSSGEQDQAEFADALDSPTQSQRAHSPAQSADAGKVAAQPAKNTAGSSGNTKARQNAGDTDKQPPTKRVKRTAAQDLAGENEGDKGAAPKRKRQQKPSTGVDVPAEGTEAENDSNAEDEGGDAVRRSRPTEDDKDPEALPKKKFSRRGKQTTGLAKQAGKDPEADEETPAPRDSKKRAKESPMVLESQEETAPAAVSNREKASQRGGPVKQGSGAHLPVTSGNSMQQKAERQNRALQETVRLFSKAHDKLQQARQHVADCAHQVESCLTDMDGMTFTMDILQKVKIGKTVSKLTKMHTQFPAYPECKQAATLASAVIENMKQQVGQVSKPDSAQPLETRNHVGNTVQQAPSQLDPKPTAPAQQSKSVKAETPAQDPVNGQTPVQPLASAKGQPPRLVSSATQTSPDRTQSIGQQPGEQQQQHNLDQQAAMQLPEQHSYRQDAVRSKAVAILQLAFIGSYSLTPLEAAEDVEQAVYAEFGEDDAPGLRYKRRLHMLWSLIAGDASLHMLKEKILQGKISPQLLAKLDRAQAAKLCGQQTASNDSNLQGSLQPGVAEAVQPAARQQTPAAPQPQGGQPLQQPSQRGQPLQQPTQGGQPLPQPTAHQYPEPMQLDLPAQSRGHAMQQQEQQQAEVQAVSRPQLFQSGNVQQIQPQKDQLQQPSLQLQQLPQNPLHVLQETQPHLPNLVTAQDTAMAEGPQQQLNATQTALPSLQTANRQHIVSQAQGHGVALQHMQPLAHGVHQQLTDQQQQEPTLSAPEKFP